MENHPRALPGKDPARTRRARLPPRLGGGATTTRQWRGRGSAGTVRCQETSVAGCVTKAIWPMAVLWTAFIGLPTNPSVALSQVVVPGGRPGTTTATDSAPPRETAPTLRYRPSLRAFPRQLVSNGVGLFARGNILPFVVGSGLTVTARALDDDIQNAMADQASGVGDTGDIMGSRLVLGGSVVGLFVAGQLAPEGRFRVVTFDLTQGLLINGVLTVLSKEAVGRMRPDSSDARSFPSGHTSGSFMIATVLGHHLGPRVGVPAFLVASFIGVSRVEANAHFMSDVVAGATLGIIVGRTVTAHLGRGAIRSRLSLSPVAAPGGGGVLVTYRW